MGSLGFFIYNFFIAYYGLSILIGIFVAAIIGLYQAKRFGKDANDFIIIVSVGGLFGIIGAKLLYILVSWSSIDFSRLTDFEYLNANISGGFVFYGGLIGGLIGLYLCKKIFKIDVWEYCKIIVPILPIVHGFGRIGCTLVGCCYGSINDGPLSIVYEESFFAPNHVHLYPVQAIEAIACFLIAIILLIYINRFNGKNGIIVYLIFYGILRFILEFFRGDDAERGIYYSLSVSQYISLGLIIFSIAYLFFNKYKKSNGI